MNNPRKDGLHLMYVGNLVTIISAVLMVIPIINVVAAIAGLTGAVLSIVGLVKLRSEHNDYMNAIVALVVSVVVGLIPGALFDALSTIAGLCMTYFVIRATNQLLDNVGHSEGRAEGDLAWKARMLSTVVTIVCTALAALIHILALPLVLVSMVVEVIALYLYLKYLKSSSEAM